MLYLWIKALHVVAIISWMAGMLYLFRLYVYHAMESEAAVRARLEVMERNLLQVITTPSMLAALATGITMLLMNPALLKQPWMHIKLTAVLGLCAMHGMASAWRKKLIQNSQFKSHRFFRVMNEVPTLLMVIIVIMIIVRPFARLAH